MFTIESLVTLILSLVVLGIIWWLLQYLIDHVNLTEPVKKVANAILVIAGILVLIALLLAFIGHPIVKY